MFRFWLVYRFLTSGRKWLNLPSTLSLVGIVLGVACLVVAMAVVSGFETTLQKAIIDVFGHVLVARTSDRAQSFTGMFERIREIAPEIEDVTPFVELQAVVAKEGKLTGVMIEGFDPHTIDHVLNVRSRVV